MQAAESFAGPVLAYRCHVLYVVWHVLVSTSAIMQAERCGGGADAAVSAENAAWVALACALRNGVEIEACAAVSTAIFQLARTWRRTSAAMSSWPSLTCKGMQAVRHEASRDAHDGSVCVFISQGKRMHLTADFASSEMA